MKKRASTLVLGIAAYNEAENIAQLLHDICAQNLVGLKLVNVIIVSDASTDQTDSIVKQFTTKLPITFIRNDRRVGLAACLNMIFAKSNSDLAVTLDADIRLKNISFLTTLTEPIIKQKAHYTSSSIEENPTTAFFSHALALSMQVKRCVYRMLRGGNNIYTSFGIARAWSKTIYQKLRFPHSVGNDMYGYLYAKTHGFDFVHTPEAIATYTLPASFREHLLQSSRFFHAVKLMKKTFDARIVKQEFAIPIHIFMQGIWTSKKLIATHPVHAIVYIFYLAICMGYARLSKQKDTWEISASTKQSQANTLTYPRFFIVARQLVNRGLGFIQKAFGIHPEGVYILCYHGIDASTNIYAIDPSIFDAHMTYLSKHFTFVTLKDIAHHVKGTRTLSKPSVAITFDDGYQSILTIQSVLKKYHISPTVFVLTNPPQVNHKELGQNNPHFLSTDEIKTLLRNGWTVGSHSATHPNLIHLSEAKLKEELVGSKTKLQNISPDADAFAYPRGKYTPNVQRAVQAAGYSMALSMDDGVITRHTNLYSIPRIGINQSHSLEEFKTLMLPFNIMVRSWIKKIYEI